METRYHGRWDAVMMADCCWNLKVDLPAAEHSRSLKKRKFKPWSLNNGEATCNLHVLTFINAHHSVYSNQCFYQVINICCWQNIFSLKNIFRMICVDKNQPIIPQKCNRFCQKIWFFSNQPRKKNLTWWRETDAIPWFSSAKIPLISCINVNNIQKVKNCCPVLLLIMILWQWGNSTGRK